MSIWLDEIAIRKEAHPGRMGGKCTPSAIVVHTTDTYPGGFGTIVKSWTQMAGGHNCAHFIIGRDETDGIVQFVPLNRNGSHAGGATHGWWIDPSNARQLHPNEFSIGIEIDNAGYLKLMNGKYIHPDTRKEMPPDQIMMAEGKAWHMPTEYQMDHLRALINEITAQPEWRPFPNTYKVLPDGPYRSNNVVWATPWRSDILGHASLDSINRLDPGPYILSKLKEWYP